MAIMCELPLLTTHHIRKVYTYTASPLVSLLRPTYLREIAAIKVLRSGTFSPEGKVPPGVEGEAEEMVRKGWKRGEKGWREYQEGLRRRNADVGRRLLAGM